MTLFSVASKKPSTTFRFQH